VDVEHRQFVGWRLKDCPVVIGLHERSAVGRRAPSGRNGWRFVRRIAKRGPTGSKPLYPIRGPNGGGKRSPQWSGWAKHNRREPVKAGTRRIDRRLANIITLCQHRLPNVFAEGLTSKIMADKRRARSYRNVGNFKGATSFSCG